MRNCLILGLVLLLVAGGLVSYAFSQQEVKDPVCGMKMKASEAKFKSEYAGKTYYFCSADCKAKFDQAPEKYVSQKDTEMSTGMKSGMKAGMKCGEKMGMMSEMKPEMVCCAMKGELMKEVKMEKKDTPDGQIFTMTSTNPEVVKKLQEMVKQCQEGKMAGQQKEMMAGHAGGKGQSTMMKEGCCLMHNKNYTSTVSDIENGVRIEIKKK
jgi:Cu+-exporting ATPase